MNILALSLQSCAMIFLVVCSAFFSASETALFSLNAAQLQDIRNRDTRGRRIAEMLARPTQILSTILIGNTIANVFAASTGYAIIDSIPPLEKYSAIITVPTVTLILLIFGEIAPKRIAIRKAKSVVIFFCRPLCFCHTLFSPLRILLTLFTKTIKPYLRPERKSLSDDELLTAVNVGAEEGVLDDDERSMVDGIIRLSEMCAADVMTPRVDFLGIDLSDHTSETFDIARKATYHYLPVYRDTPDSIVGFLDVAAYLLDPEHNMQAALHEPVFVPETVALDDLLITLERSRRHIACVTDEYGGTAGLITRSDILEIITGDLPSDKSESADVDIKQIDQTHWLIDGDTSLDEINHELGLELEAEGADRISGWVIAQAGRFLRVGESVEAQGCRVEIKQRKKLRINEVVLEIIPKPTDAEEVDEENVKHEEDEAEVAHDFLPPAPPVDEDIAKVVASNEPDIPVDITLSTDEIIISAIDEEETV